LCVYSTARGPAVSVARPQRVPRPRATSRRPVTHTHPHGHRLSPAAAVCPLAVTRGCTRPSFPPPSRYRRKHAVAAVHRAANSWMWGSRVCARSRYTWSGPGQVPPHPATTPKGRSCEQPLGCREAQQHAHATRLHARSQPSSTPQYDGSCNFTASLTPKLSGTPP